MSQCPDRTEQLLRRAHPSPQHLHAAHDHHSTAHHGGVLVCEPGLTGPPLVVLLSCPSVSLSFFSVLGGVAIEHE